MALMQFLWTLTPVIIMLGAGMISYSVAQQNKINDTKADKPTVDALCEKIKGKADNATIVQMLETLKQKDSYLEQKNSEQDEKINYNRDIMIRQIEVQKSTEVVMKNIEMELIKLNNNRKVTTGKIKKTDEERQ